MARARRRGRRGLKFEVNIVLLFDVLLVLLLIFMAAAPIVAQSMEVDLPDTTESQAVSNNDKPPVIIKVSDTGQYSAVIEKDRMDQLPPERVIAEAKSHLQTNPKTVSLIGGVRDMPYDEVIKALNLLHNADIESVDLVTQSIW